MRAKRYDRTFKNLISEKKLIMYVWTRIGADFLLSKLDLHIMVFMLVRRPKSARLSFKKCIFLNAMTFSAPEKR